MRTEHDLLGSKEIEDDPYYGIQTKRALENFNITGIPISSTPELIIALAYVKKAAAITNSDLGVLPPKLAEAISLACDEIISGKFHTQFVVDVIQGGAGTSTNMNANEVIANRALEHLGQPKGMYHIIHPNNHVNCSQSTNDVYPTAFRLALQMKLSKLLPAMLILQESCEAKEREFADIIKMGRTQLQDAVPMTLGQTFGAYATTVGEDINLIAETRKLIHEINLGATAIGTGINTPPQYTKRITSVLQRLTNLPLTTSVNLIEATWDTGAYVQISGVLKRLAVKLSKICNDLRLLSSGPRAGLNEINLPKMQPGSSIMPGKVNPVIPEVVNQVAYQVIGADVTVTMAAEAGQLELNVMEPVMAYNLFQSISMLTQAYTVLSRSCISGISANREHCRQMVENSIGIVTALNPVLGYEQASEVAQIALASNRSVYQVVLEKKLLSEQELAGILTIENLIYPSADNN